MCILVELPVLQVVNMLVYDSKQRGLFLLAVEIELLSDIIYVCLKKKTAIEQFRTE